MGKLNYSARKRLPDGHGFKAAARDPTLEIDISNKNLTDKDLSLFIDDLLECIRRDLAKVTEFHIQRNNLTIQSLPMLGEVIALNAGELRELDISNNNINVNPTSEDKEAWCKFLSSFRNCYMVKKLDLSGNPLGSVGMENLARVYIKSDLDFLEDDAEAIVEPKHDERSLIEDTTVTKVTTGKENEGSTRGSRPAKSPNKGKKTLRQSTGQPKSTPIKSTTHDDLKRFACTRGLRSIAYLILSDVYMAKSGTVHLASMLSMQRTSEQLLKFLPGGKSLTLPETAHCKSIIWLPNENLPQMASDFLGKAEAINEIKAHIDSDDELSNDSDDQRYDAAIAEEIADPSHKIDTAAQRELQNKKNIEYARLTKRIRMEALHDEGVRDTDLWITALRMMNVSRIILWKSKNCRVGALEKEQDQQEDENKDEHNSSTVHIEDVTQRVEDIEITEHSSFPEPSFPPIEFQVTEPAPIGPFHPGTDKFESDFPMLQPSTTDNIETEITGRDAEPVVATTNDLPSSQTSIQGKGNIRSVHGPRVPRKENETWRFGFTFEIWRRIIAGAVSADGILDLTQQTQIMRYATDQKTLKDEMDITGLEHHQQVWRILEKNNCFIYSPL
ncbi:uncharacterized protein BDW43DRAFT_321816 [Aspergillus alliaceus]|uniref:uncharacterized protein n=1 Tax=Petromyces alliaceus TaxID=209559 RepID=UPI0012A65788|nr:uncharacterized protein BDW43DRAFT_321816 [Aspergillus alliaceus]KAB8229778.1 hypothetical protein BDW43DRAFT_321816 [Aspergillus alliaceus]